MLKAVYLIAAIAAALYGALKLYHAFRNHGDFDAYTLGLLFAILGCVMFWKVFSSSARKVGEL